MQAMEAGDHELERRLDAYARARLSPDPAGDGADRVRG